MEGKKEVKRELRAFSQADEKEVEQQLKMLTEVRNKPFWTRIKTYVKMSGPAWLAVGMTLGAGSSLSALAQGSAYGFKLAWTQWVGIIIGILYYFAIARIVLASRAQLHDAFNKYVHPIVGYGLYCFACAVATIIWNAPQYGLGAAAIETLCEIGLGHRIPLVIPAILLFAWAAFMGLSYGKGGSARWVSYIENITGVLVTVLIFLLPLTVLIKVGLDGRGLLKGLFGFWLPPGKQGVTILVSTIGAACGITMYMLYPYTLLAKRWRIEHEGLARFDTVTRLGIAFSLATITLISVAAMTIYKETGGGVVPGSIYEYADILRPLLGDWATAALAIALLACPLTTLYTHELVMAFSLCGLLNKEPDPTKTYWKVFVLLTNIAVFGVWYPKPLWLPILASAFNASFLPLVQCSIYLLLNHTGLLGKHTPSGTWGHVWNFLLLIAAGVSFINAEMWWFAKAGLW